MEMSDCSQKPDIQIYKENSVVSVCLRLAGEYHTHFRVPEPMYIYKLNQKLICCAFRVVVVHRTAR